MAVARIEIKDEVNIRIRGISSDVLVELKNALSYYVAGHRFMPKFKMGWWDGKISLFSETGASSLNLLDDIIPILQVYGYEIEVEDHRLDYSEIIDQLTTIDSSYYSMFSNRKTGKPIELWDHQVGAVNSAIEAGAGLLELATGAGKTFICSILARKYMEFGRVVVIVPDTDLILQTQAEFKSVDLDTGIWYASVKERKQVTIATWQSLDGYRELFDGVICVIVDEAHTAKANVLNDILTTAGARVPFRFGVTGTVPPEKLTKQQLKASLGEILYSVRTKELQDKGVLASASIYQILLDDISHPDFSVDVADDRMADSWNVYIQYLLKEQMSRMRFIAESITDMADSGNTFVLVPYRDTGKILQSMIPNSISLDGRDKNRLSQYEEFDKSENAILICTLKIAEKGIDITRLYNLVLIEPGKQFARILQAFGRGLRRGKDKTHVNLYDFASNYGISNKHAKDRIKLYKQAKQEFEIIEVGYDELPE